MEDFKEVIAAVDLVDKMVERAIAVVDGAPYWKYVFNKEWARLSFVKDGAEAQLSYFEETLSYDNPIIDGTTVCFPSDLLFLPEAAFVAWKEHQREIYNRTEEKRRVQRVKEIEIEERATFAALKLKYGC